MFTFLLVVHAIIAAALVAVILMQRSEGGGLGMGGSPTGLMSARGAADFLTRATTILATLFVVMSIGLAVLASVQNGPRTIDTSLSRQPGAAGGLTPAVPAAGNGVPLAGDPLAGIAASAGNTVAPADVAAPAAPATTTPAPRTTTPARPNRPVATGPAASAPTTADRILATRASPPAPAPAGETPTAAPANGATPPTP